MKDGSRLFAEFPQSIFFDEFYDYTKKLGNVANVEIITDGIVEMWVDFEYRKNKFSVNNQFGDYWFFVEDANCSDGILLEVCEHFRPILEK